MLMLSEQQVDLIDNAHRFSDMYTNQTPLVEVIRVYGT